MPKCPNKCKYRGKLTQAGYVWKWSETPSKCHLCKVDNMILKERLCKSCKLSYPSFNYKGQSAMYCGFCKLEGMVNVKNFLCMICHEREASYNTVDSTLPEYCSICRTEDMVDIKNALCKGCNKKRAYYNFSKNLKPEFCRGCASKDMVNLTTKGCVNCGNGKRVYKKRGDKSKLYCWKCTFNLKLEEREDMCSNCLGLKATHNFNNENMPLFCEQCALPGMIVIPEPVPEPRKKRKFNEINPLD